MQSLAAVLYRHLVQVAKVTVKEKFPTTEWKLTLFCRSGLNRFDTVENDTGLFFCWCCASVLLTTELEKLDFSWSQTLSNVISGASNKAELVAQGKTVIPNQLHSDGVCKPRQFWLLLTFSNGQPDALNINTPRSSLQWGGTSRRQLNEYVPCTPDPLRPSSLSYSPCAHICLAVKGLPRTMKSSFPANRLNSTLKEFHPLDWKIVHFLQHFTMTREAFLNCMFSLNSWGRHRELWH